jgi:hypothetical protein
MLTREHVLAEIRRTAEANGGVALGKARFEAATGIREHDWRGRFWARWSDAVVEAGFAPNQLQGRIDQDRLIDSLVDEIRRLGRMPTNAELRLRRRADPDFPAANVFDRFGPKAGWAAQVLEYCNEHEDCADVAEIVAPLVVAEEAAVDTEPGQHGFVYLLKSGKHYKIGHTLDVGRRKYELAIQLPEAVREEHVIATDDPVGIERYWHARFADRRKNGEWFDLTRADITAFKRRKFM